MKLNACEACQKQISSEAAACPSCGHPQKAVRQKIRGDRQGGGCLLIILSMVLGMFSPILGSIAFIVGFVLLLWGFVS